MQLRAIIPGPLHLQAEEEEEEGRPPGLRVAQEVVTGESTR